MDFDLKSFGDLVIQRLEDSGIPNAVGLSPSMLGIVLCLVLGGTLALGLGASLRRRSNWKKMGDEFPGELAGEQAGEETYPNSQELSEMDPTVPAKPLD